jgi:hypothetical protein
VRRPAAIELVQATGPPKDARAQARILGHKPSGEIDRGDVLVHGIGGDVFVEEQGCLLTESQSSQPVGVTAIGIEEVISNSARCPTIAPASAGEARTATSG